MRKTAVVKASTQNFRVGVWWGKVCFIMDSKFGFTSSCWRNKPGWFVLLKSANCYKAFLCRHREVLRKEVDLLTGGGWNRTRLKLLTTGLQWVLPILPSLNLSFGLSLRNETFLFGTTTLIEYFFLTDRERCGTSAARAASWLRCHSSFRISIRLYAWKKLFDRI